MRVEEDGEAAAKRHRCRAFLVTVLWICIGLVSSLLGFGIGILTSESFIIISNDLVNNSGENAGIIDADIPAQIQSGRAITRRLGLEAEDPDTFNHNDATVTDLDGYATGDDDTAIFRLKATASVILNNLSQIPFKLKPGKMALFYNALLPQETCLLGQYGSQREISTSLAEDLDILSHNYAELLFKQDTWKPESEGTVGRTPGLLNKYVAHWDESYHLHEPKPLKRPTAPVRIEGEVQKLYVFKSEVLNASLSGNMSPPSPSIKMDPYIVNGRSSKKAEVLIDIATEISTSSPFISDFRRDCANYGYVEMGVMFRGSQSNAFGDFLRKLQTASQRKIDNFRRPDVWNPYPIKTVFQNIHKHGFKKAFHEFRRGTLTDLLNFSPLDEALGLASFRVTCLAG